MAKSTLDERRNKLAESLMPTAKRMGITANSLSKMSPKDRERAIGRIIKQKKVDDAALRGVNPSQSTWGKKLQKVDGKRLQGILDSGTYGGGKKLTDRQRMFIQGELDRRKWVEAGPGHVMFESGGKKYIVKGKDFKTNLTALSAIQSGQVSFDPGATRGLSGDVRSAYGKARESAIKEALDVIGADTAFKRPEGWDGMTQSQQLMAYSDYLYKSAPSSHVTTYRETKEQFLQNRRENEAAGRAKIVAAGTANPVSDAGTGNGNVNSNAPAPVPVYTGDLVPSAPGYSGQKGNPYRAGDARGRGVQEVMRARAREASEQAMYKDQQKRDQEQQKKDAEAFRQYHTANYETIRAREEYELTQRRIAARRIKQATQYAKMADYAERIAQAGGGGQ